MKSLFTYSVKNTSWLIVVTENAAHYYFNKDSREAVWQLAETDIVGLESKVDFNELAILFGRANGYKLPSPKGQERDDLHRTKKQRQAEITDDQSATSVVQNEDTRPTAEESQPSEDKGSQVPQTLHVSQNLEETASTGLDLGYSSSDDESAEEEAAETNMMPLDADASIDADSSDNGVNSGLDLGLSSDEDEGSTTSANRDTGSPFLDLLEEFSDRISVFDPWSVVQEELMSEFVKRPEYFAVSDDLREEIYNKWSRLASKRQLSKAESKQNSSDEQLITEEHEARSTDRSEYPNATLLFYKFLQDFKKEVKELYYPEFRRRHGPELQDLLSSVSLPNPEDSYRKLRVVLNDYAKLERESKKGNGGKFKADGIASGTNFKVTQVRTFLANSSVPLRIGLALDGTKSHFDQWMQICNHHEIPSRIVNHPTNFILGDEKRLQCYVEYFGL